MALPAQLHASTALAPYCLKNCDQDAAWRIYPKRVWFGKGQVQQEGAQVQKKGSHLQKKCSKVHEKRPGPKDIERGPKNVFPVNRYIQTLGTEGSSSPSKATLAKVSFIVSCRFPAPLCDPG